MENIPDYIKRDPNRLFQELEIGLRASFQEMENLRLAGKRLTAEEFDMAIESAKEKALAELRTYYQGVDKASDDEKAAAQKRLENKNRILANLKKGGKRFLVAATIAIAGLGLKDSKTEYEYEYDFEEDKKEFGVKVSGNEAENLPDMYVYFDEDPMTNAILNYITKKENLPEKIKLTMTRNMLINRITDSFIFWHEKHIDIDSAVRDRLEALQDKLDSMNDEEFLEYIKTEEAKNDMVEIYSGTASRKLTPENASNTLDSLIAFQKDKMSGYHRSYLDEDALKMLDAIEKNDPNAKEILRQYIIDTFSPEKALNIKDINPDEFDIDLYNKVWILHKKNRNPNINIRTGGGGYGHRAYYNGLTNEMYVNVGEGHGPLFDIEEWVAEISHAKQFDEKPILSAAKGIYSFFTTFRRVFVLSERNLEKSSAWEGAYDGEYITPGTLEYEAHSEIEPKLRNILGMEQEEH